MNASEATRRSSRVLRYLLGGLLAFVAVNAFGGGYYGLMGAQGVPREWLSGSPFPDYFVPSLILFTVVGGTFLAGAVAVFAGARSARLLATAAGVIAIGWISAQLAILGFVSWLQPATLFAGVLVLVLARRLSRSSATGSRPELSEAEGDSQSPGTVRRPAR